MPKRAKKLGPNFTLKNSLITIRYWSKVYTTSLFDKKVKKYILTCQYPLQNFNLDILKDHSAAQLYIDVGSRSSNKLYIARIGDFECFADQKAITLHLTLNNIRLKEAWNMEFDTPAIVYENILADKKFFFKTGRSLDNFISELGLRRKVGETDQSFRRRTLAYLQYQLDDTNVLSEEELRKLKGDK